MKRELWQGFPRMGGCRILSTGAVWSPKTRPHQPRLHGLLSRFDGELDRMLQAASETTIGRKICCQELTTVLVCKDTNRKVAVAGDWWRRLWWNSLLNMWYTREPREASRHHDEVLHKSTVKSKDCDSILTEGQNKIYRISVVRECRRLITVSAKHIQPKRTLYKNV